MGVMGSKVVRPRPLEVRGSAVEREVLERVGQGQPVTLSNLALWRARCENPSDAQVLDRLYSSLFEAPIKSGDVEISSTEVGKVGANSGHALASKRIVEGDLPEVADFLERMPEGLWGQEAALAAFSRARADGLSTTRRTPSLLVLGGGIGHGKLEALAAFEELLATPPKAEGAKPTPAKRVEVDLSTAVDGMVPDLFIKDDAPLGLKALKVAAEAGNVLVVLKNPTSLAQDAPKVATLLNDLLNTEEPWIKKLHFVADFDLSTSAHAELGKSLGAPAVRQVSAVADFGQLDARTMLKYADQLLPQLLAKSRIENVRVIFDGEHGAREVLGRALATPNEPLDDLQPRLQQFVLSHLHTQTSFNPETSVIKFSLAPAFANDLPALEQLLQELHQPLTELGAGRRLFVAEEVAERPAVTDADVGLIWSVATDHLDSLREQLPQSGALRRLDHAIESMARQSDSSQAYGWAERITPRQYAVFVERSEVLGEEIAQRFTAALEALPPAAPLESPELKSFSEQAEALLGLQRSLAPLANDSEAEGFVGRRLLELFKQLTEERNKR